MNRKSDSLGWILVLGGFLLLVSAGRLDWLILLIPAAAVLAYAFTRPGHTRA